MCMTSEDTPETSVIEVRWSATLLNTYTIALMLIAPFWAALMVTQGKEIGLVLLGLLLFGMISLSVLNKPLFSYDPERREFSAPDGKVLRLDQIESIEMDAHDLYFIPKSHSQDGWHLSQRCWVLAPRRTLKALASQQGWPLKDIAHPISRFGFWLVP
ncbi:hypothetical protein Astex_0113 [Asticcacaulis excentricus CB 48]|uniref:Uncharacterized protein n=2 Tax=Asticcacaulis excentricus TaxID=78587 RepID=E8RNI3_ASTEC|nr:hypothetical protein Astex_0113 [Asticcacaulis excentricus CB 48]